MSKRHITLPDSLESLFVRLEEIILANSGEDEFEEIFKLVTAKLWDEVHDTNFFQPVSNEEDILRNISTALTMLQREWGDILVEPEIKLQTQHLAVCVRLLSNYKLTNFGFEALDAFFEFIVARTAKGAKGQFFTPRYVVDFCVRILAPKAHETILDPACGSGAFLLHSHQFLSTRYKSQEDPNNLWGFDFDEKAVRVARTLMYVAGVGRTNIHKVNSLIVPRIQPSIFESENHSIATIEDYLRVRKMGADRFDIILTNPPFAGEITEMELLNAYSISQGKQRIERDALFLERCVELLKPGGRMAVVVPNNKVGGKEWADLRKWIIQNARVIGVIGLPRSMFMPHTSIKTSILFLEKRLRINKKPNENIFFGISEKSGKDSRGVLEFISMDNPSWNNIDHDLNEIERSFTSFLRDEKVGWCR
ncbi:HsdM family class I SAM-dependent methyltransferase [Tumebacillus flagellatus]|uniref:DNA methylase adenine-specific domain-containing protein n=1 Tax=Tumebacillus flagellatus TaxID=1157490 RepID=A0A074MA83_9BACL|nr:N-6 DNA methylase [Tumebacillus flagellatus]KEO82862.1 hypothetical protein EL26_13215 [Tumebacillus flagellatus]